MPNVTEFHPKRHDAEWQTEVRRLLSIGDCEFNFQKVDGSVRKMVCTLQESVVPETKGGKPKAGDAFTVYDTESSGWRTIKYEKIISFKAI